MRTLTPAERRTHRAAAHHLHPVVAIGQHGLTPAVLKAVDVALAAHELVKVRVFSDDRDEREALLARICEALDAAPVQHLGKILTVWRPEPEPAQAPAPAARGPRTRKPAAARSPAGPAGTPRPHEPADRESTRDALPGAPTAKRSTVGPSDRRRAPAGARPGAPAAGRGRGPVPGARRRRRIA